MPLIIVRNDILRMKVDAIVNSANPTLLGGGGLDGQIHKAAGPRLLEACRKLGGCPVGSAKITKGYLLPCKYVIHAVGPRYRDGQHGEEALLASCYRSAMALAQKHRCRSVAFPLISCGIYDYPKDQALHVAVSTLSEALFSLDMTVYIVVFGSDSLQIGKKLFADIGEYIDDNYVQAHTVIDNAERSRRLAQFDYYQRQEHAGEEAARSTSMLSDAMLSDAMPLAAMSPAATLSDALSRLDESFSQMLLRKIDEKGMTDAACYHRANIDRKLFSKIRKDAHYKPSKPTVLAFAIALELPLEETQEMLRKAGFALSHSNKFDVIVEYFILQGNYDIYEINEALFSFDQALLGG